MISRTQSPMVVSSPSCGSPIKNPQSKFTELSSLATSTESPHSQDREFTTSYNTQEIDSTQQVYSPVACRSIKSKRTNTCSTKCSPESISSSESYLSEILNTFKTKEQIIPFNVDSEEMNLRDQDTSGLGLLEMEAQLPTSPVENYQSLISSIRNIYSGIICSRRLCEQNNFQANLKTVLLKGFHNSLLECKGKNKKALPIIQISTNQAYTSSKRNFKVKEECQEHIKHPSSSPSGFGLNRAMSSHLENNCKEPIPGMVYDLKPCYNKLPVPQTTKVFYYNTFSEMIYIDSHLRDRMPTRTRVTANECIKNETAFSQHQLPEEAHSKFLMSQGCLALVTILEAFGLRNLKSKQELYYQNPLAFGTQYSSPVVKEIKKKLVAPHFSLCYDLELYCEFVSFVIATLRLYYRLLKYMKKLLASSYVSDSLLSKFLHEIYLDLEIRAVTVYNNDFVEKYLSKVDQGLT